MLVLFFLRVKIIYYYYFKSIFLFLFVYLSFSIINKNYSIIFSLSKSILFKRLMEKNEHTYKYKKNNT